LQKDAQPKPGAFRVTTNLSTRDVEKCQDHLRLTVDLVDAPIVITVIDASIINILAAILGWQVDYTSGGVLADPRVPVEPIAGV
jgi:hypothetical protein